MTNNNINSYEVIVDRLKSMILNEELKVGDKLAPERELAEQLNVSRASLREALKTLESFGLIESRQGSGSYVVNNMAEKMADNLSLVFVLDQCKMSDLTWLRRNLAKQTLINLFNEQDPAMRKTMEEFLNRVDRATNIDDVVSIDVDFHHYIFQSEPNPLTKYIYSALATIYERNIRFMNSHFTSWYNWSLEESKAYEREIFAAMLGSDKEKLKETIDAHFVSTIDDDLDDLYEQFKEEVKVNGK